MSMQHHGDLSAFAEPFSDYSAAVMPKTIMDALRWSERCVVGDGVYRAAIERIVSYFITEVEITGTDRANKQKYKDFLHNKLGIQSVLRQIALDFMVYGNSFISLIIPFRRNLACKGKGCGYEVPLEIVSKSPGYYGYGWSGFEFQAKCPKCGYTGGWRHIDRRSSEEGDIVIKRWNPHEMEINWDPYSDETSYIWKIPQYYKAHIVAGHIHQLQRAPWEVIEAVRANGHFQFNKGVMYHAKENTLAGVLNKGWGISRVLSNFRQAWYLQVLRRYNEAIGLDYIIPFRLITPAPRNLNSGSGEIADPLLSMDMGNFSSRIQGIVNQHRQDPATYHVLPFPVQYQMLGAEAGQMTPFQMIDQATDALLNAIGTPVEFYKGTLTLQNSAPALRLFESNFSQLCYCLNHILQWLMNQLTTLLSWDDVKATMVKPSYADDLSRQLAVLQLMMGKQISQSTGLKRGVGLDFEEESRKMLDEEKFIAEESKKTQEELEGAGLGDQMAQSGASPQGAPGMPSQVGGQPGPVPAAPGGQGGAAAPQGGTAGGAAPGQPVDPVQAIIAQITFMNSQDVSLPDLQTAAQTISDQVFALSPPDRIRVLREMKKMNPAVHALVKSLLDSKEAQAKQQGVQMSRQAAQGAQQGSMAPPPG